VGRHIFRRILGLCVAHNRLLLDLWEIWQAKHWLDRFTTRNALKCKNKFDRVVFMRKTNCGRVGDGKEITPYTTRGSLTAFQISIGEDRRGLLAARECVMVSGWIKRAELTFDRSLFWSGSTFLKTRTHNLNLYLISYLLRDFMGPLLNREIFNYLLQRLQLLNLVHFKISLSHTFRVYAK
jgi:hypothetical protein